MQKKTYADKQREAQQLKKQEELRARSKNSPAPDSPKTDAVARTKEVKKRSKADRA